MLSNLSITATPIRTLHSSVAIEDLKVGDIVLSRDEFNSGAAVAGRRVEAVFVRRAVVMSIGVGGRIIETTEEHPFWVIGKGWTAANAMRVGDRVLTATGEPLLIESVGEARREATVYNFRVEEWHTYFVGDLITWGFDVWVHNNHVAQRSIQNELGKQQKAIDKILNSIRMNLKPGPKGDLAGVVSEMLGNRIPHIKKPGKFHDHIQEMDNTVQALTKGIKTLESSKLPGAQSAILKVQAALTEIKAAIQGLGI